MAPSPLLTRSSPCSPTNAPLAKARRFPAAAAGAATTAERAAAISKGRLELKEAMQSLEEDHSVRGGQQAYYNSLVSLCISNRALREGQRLRSHMARVGYEPGLFLDNQFINLYAKCGAVDMARALFDRMPQRNVVSWNALIAGYCSGERFPDALSLFRDMIEAGSSPNHWTYLGAVRASIGCRDLEFGKQIHSRVMKEDLLTCVEVGNALINLYAGSGREGDAEATFESMAKRDEVSWNSLIAADVRNRRGEGALALFVEMQEAGFAPDEFTFGSLLGSRGVTAVRELHAQVAKRGLGSNVFAGAALLDAYARSGDPRAACSVFDSMPERNTVAWNSLIDACFGNDMADHGLELFLRMGHEQGVLPDEYTISILLKAARTQLSTAVGKQLHGSAVKMGLHADTLTGNHLVAMYAEHGAVPDSWRAFKSISEPDLISWNSMVRSYVQNEKHEQALKLFGELKHYGVEPDEFSFVGALAACASLAWRGTGREVHCDLIKRGLAPVAFIGSALIDMYAKCMAVHDARKVFNGIRNKDSITWNSMIAGFAQNGYLDEVLRLLCMMRGEELEPDNFTFASVLAACGNDTAYQQGKQVHALVLKSELNTDAAVNNALVTMYSRAGSIEEAEKVFSKFALKNIISWTAMIGGYVQCGYSIRALQIFDKMESAEVTPNGKTFVALLTACSHAGLSDEAVRYFRMMETEYGIRPGFDHYACVVDILGRAGRLEEAEMLIKGMPFEPGALVWRMLLSACRIHGDLDRGKRSMEQILAIEPGDSAAYVLLSNLYAGFGNWDGVMEVRQLMRTKGVKKEPGKSSIELRDRVHEFMAGDRSHTRTEDIYLNLRGLFKQMKDEGYVPGIECLGGREQYKI